MKRLIKKSEVMNFYHGTSSDSLDSILSSGLKVTDGGSGDGAYVTKDYNEARKYALKRAGERKTASVTHNVEQFKDVTPIVITLSLDSNELKQAFGEAMFAEEGIPADKIVNTEDLSNDPIWQNLLAYLEVENRDSNNEAIQNYRLYANEVRSIV